MYILFVGIMPHPMKELVPPSSRFNATTLEEAEQYIRRRSSGTQHDPDYPDVIIFAAQDGAGHASWLLAAVLQHAMQQKEIPEARLVTFTAWIPLPEQHRFILSGMTCIDPVWASVHDIDRYLHAQPIAYTEHSLRMLAYEQDARIFREAAIASYEMVTGRYRVQWTYEEVQVLLSGFQAHQHRRKLDTIVLNRLGGLVRARATLLRCADELGGDEGTILHDVMKGLTQKMIGIHIHRSREEVNRIWRNIVPIKVRDWLNQTTTFSLPMNVDEPLLD